MKKALIITLLLALLLCSLSSCSYYHEFDQETVTINRDNFSRYMYVSGPKSKVEFNLAQDRFEYTLSIQPERSYIGQVSEENLFLNCIVTLRLTVNEQSQDVTIQIDNNGSSQQLTYFFENLNATYTFNTSCEIVSASGQVISKNSLSKGRPYITYFGENKGAILNYWDSTGWELEYINPRKVFYISNIVYTKSGNPIYYDGYRFLNNTSSIKWTDVEVLIFDGNFNVKSSIGGGNPTFNENDFIVIGNNKQYSFNIKDTFPNLKVVYIKNTFNDEYLFESEQRYLPLFALPEHGVTFYVDDGVSSGLCYLLQKSSFVNGIYPASEFDISQYIER